MEDDFTFRVRVTRTVSRSREFGSLLMVVDDVEDVEDAESDKEADA